VRRVISVCVDVTEREAAEAASLEASQRFRMFYEESPVPYELLDAEGRILDVNDAYLDAMGYQHKNQVLGRLWTEFFAEESRLQVTGRFEQYKSQGGVRQLDLQAVRKDGRRIHIMLDCQVGHDAKGQVDRLHCVWSDITDRKLAQLALAQAKAEAEAASEAKDRLLSTVSHELRTPLTPVLVKLSALQENPQSPQWVQGDLASMRRSVELESRLIDGLLDLTRMTQSKVRMRPEIVDAHALLERSLGMAAEDGDVNHPAVERQFAAAHSQVCVDVTQLQQVCWNIIKNALQYTHDGGCLTICTRNDAEGKLVIEFKDTGLGIDPAFLPRVFQAFERGQHAGHRRPSGLGLGMTIAKSLTEQLGGELSVASDGLGKGATFTLRLPVTAAEKPREPAVTPAQPTPPLRILLVEDDVPTLEAIANVLKAMGHTVTTATTVKAAIAAAKAENHELLISDIGLPDGTGLDVIEWFNEHRPIPCMALSGYGAEKDLERSRDAGFEMHVVKPISVATLRWAIAEVTQKAPTHQVISSVLW